MEILMGVAALLGALCLFSLFSFKAPNGSAAMSGLADAAIATFLVEAIHKYVMGNLLGISYLADFGNMVGGMGGIAAATLVMLRMGVQPVYAIVTGLAMANLGILEGFIVGYLFSFAAPLFKKYLPEGVDVILGVLTLAPLARLVGIFISPGLEVLMGTLASMITEATLLSPIAMGFLLGGLIKMVCTSPLSSMALTAMLGLTGLPMGIAAIACVGGSFTNGYIFHSLKLGKSSNTISVMLEPLTQAHIVTRNPVPIFMSNFIGGALAGVIAAYFGIINDAPGSAAPIPGLLASIAFNEPHTLLMATVAAAIAGLAGGIIGNRIYNKLLAERIPLQHFANG
ncbi:PTS sugar transporter subunit IIC [Photobacterium sp. BZF1]|uniref:PTS sugar transporter subunit IIC n=1 Tax=Photobacterium TaxID=657 RepID=UPI001653A3E1|nr:MULTISPECIES: PTS sugar transporter subunit IIC [Photobacterium]MBC7005865.1 PTS sugar transporter subunit IIC [Photobacterium sp. BZF1]MBY5943954.1 PTS sugar transporter subunit IIC [Photobacterium rosenbergii]